jgi:GNAT superfamily N-acetyltransferase
MAVYPIARYPKAVTLRDETAVQLRPMTTADAEGLLVFFRAIPEEERFLMKDDVTSPEVVCHWADHLDYDRALPLLALADGRIVADAVLIRHRGGSRAHLGEIRVVVDPAYRGKGLGVVMMQELIEIAYDAELERVLFEMVTDVQDEAIAAATFLGAFPVGTVTDLAKDSHGRPHDVVFLALPLGKWYEWAKF